MDSQSADGSGLGASAAHAARYLAEKALDTLTHPLSTQQRVYWLYLLTALLMAVVVYYATRRNRGERTSLFRWLFPRDVFLHSSSIVDYKFFFINRFLFAALIAPLLFSAFAVSDGTMAVISNLFGELGTRNAQWFDRVAYTMGMVLAADFAVFLGHYLQHRVPALWEFHKVHHSAQVLNPITLYRMHPVDDILVKVLALTFVGIADGVFRSFYATSPDAILLMRLNVVFAIYLLSGYNLRHSHVWLSYPPWLSRWLISPAQHQIHHSSAEHHHDRNLGLIFAFWDRMIGTLYVPRSHERIDYGLAGGEDREFRSTWQLYMRPFRSLARLSRRREA